MSPQGKSELLEVSDKQGQFALTINSLSDIPALADSGSDDPAEYDLDDKLLSYDPSAVRVTEVV